jgi:tetratricopeptide (TPR) repeat protein
MVSGGPTPGSSDWTNIQWEEMIVAAEKALIDEQYQAAEATLFTAMELASKFGEADVRFVYTLDKLAECLWYRGQLDDAENYCKQLLRIHESVLTVDPLNIPNFFNNLALIKHAGKHFDEAEKYYKRALKGKANVLGEGHPEVLRIRSNYADLLRVRGRAEEAQKMSSSSRVVTVRDWQTSTISKTWKQKDSGESKFTQSQEMKQRVAGGRDINERKTVSFSRDEALLLWDANKQAAEKAQAEGDLELSERHWLLTLKVLETVADKSVELTYTLDLLSQFAHQRHDYMAAIDYCKRSYELKVKILGARNPVVAKCADMLARLFYLVSDYEQAEPFAKKCLDYYEKMGESESIEAGCALHNLATLYHVQRKYTEAEPLYKRALVIKSKAFGEDHPETVRLLRSYGHVLMSTNKQAQMAKSAQMITGSWKAVTMADAESLLSTD